MNSILEADVSVVSLSAKRSPATGGVRILRTIVLGATSLGLACAAHTVGGGRLPSVAVLVVAAVLLGLVSVTATARRCRMGLLLALLTIQQTVLHVVFEVASAAGAHCGAMVEMAGHHASQVGHGVAACTAAPAMVAGAMTGPGWAMWVGHLTATALTALLLARAEAWLWRVADRIIASATAAPSHLPGRPRHLSPSSHRSAVLARGVYSPAVPRGPPLPLVVS